MVARAARCGARLALVPLDRRCAWLPQGLRIFAPEARITLGLQRGTRVATV